MLFHICETPGVPENAFFLKNLWNLLLQSVDVVPTTIIMDRCGWRGKSEMYVFSWSPGNLCKKFFLSEQGDITQTGKHTYTNVAKPRVMDISWFPQLISASTSLLPPPCPISNRRKISNTNCSGVAWVSFCFVSVVLLNETGEFPETTVWNTVLVIQEKAPTVGYPTVGPTDCFW